MTRPAIPEATRQQVGEALARLRTSIPKGWEVDVFGYTGNSATLRVASENSEGRVAVLPRKRITPREVPKLPVPTSPTVVASQWISPRTRELLRQRGIGFVDSTGNMEVRLVEPGLYIRTSGADRDPNPKPTGGPTLRGPRAWALLRTLIEVVPPYGVQDLSTALQIDAGYVSRVLKVLEGELLIDRKQRGPVLSVDWEGTLRKLASTYSLFGANETSTWVAPSGAEQLLRDLAEKRAGRWAVTGSFASAKIVSIAAPETAVLYTTDPERLAKAGRLLSAATGTNVVLALPYDDIVFERTRESAGVPSVSVAQTAVDCLTGPGRMPEEGEALIVWMRRNARRWQTSSLAETKASG